MMTLFWKRKTSTGSTFDFLLTIATKAGPKPERDEGNIFQPTSPFCSTYLSFWEAGIQAGLLRSGLPEEKKFDSKISQLFPPAWKYQLQLASPSPVLFKTLEYYWNIEKYQPCSESAGCSPSGLSPWHEREASCFKDAIVDCFMIGSMCFKNLFTWRFALHLRWPPWSALQRRGGSASNACSARWKDFQGKP